MEQLHPGIEKKGVADSQLKCDKSSMRGILYQNNKSNHFNILKPLKLKVVSNWWFNIVDVNIVNIGRPPTFVCCLSLVSSARLHLSPSLFHNCLWRHTSKHLWYHQSRSAEVFLRFVTLQDLDFKIFPFFLRLKRGQDSLPENCKSHMKKHAPLWRPRVTFLSTPVLLLLGKEYLVAKLRKAIMRSLLGTKCSLAEGWNLFCLLHLTPSAHE